MSQIEMRRNQYELRPLKTLDETLEQEFSKGEISGMRMLMQLVKDMIEEDETLIEVLKEAEDGAETTDE